jgi:NitT/TauT family transport system substrate-binding protein
MALIQTRRRFIGGAAAAGAAGAIGGPRAVAAEAALDTTAVRIAQNSICLAPMYACAELLRADGFGEIRFVELAAGTRSINAVAQGEVDFAASLPVTPIKAIGASLPVTVLGGVHVGCYELFAHGAIRSVADLKGRAVGLQAAPADLLRLMAANVGLDAEADIHWVTDPNLQPLELFAQGKIDAFLGFPPEPQELRTRNAGHVILSTAVDRPWSEYFCCMIAANRDYVRNYPVATKRFLRAVLKTADLCVGEPARVARQIVDGGFTARYDYALQTLKDVPFERWRDYDPEDSVRFYALRLHDVGLLKATPGTIIAEGTDWRFFNELKRELKA